MFQFVLFSLISISIALPYCLIAVFSNLILNSSSWFCKLIHFNSGLGLLDLVTTKLRRFLRGFAAHTLIFVFQNCFKYHFEVYVEKNRSQTAPITGSEVGDPESFQNLQHQIFQNANNIVISNHVLYQDPCYIWNFLTVACEDATSSVFLMKGDLRKIPLVGRAMEFLGFMFLARKAEVDLAYIERNVESLQEKRLNLVIFPEGTLVSKETKDKIEKSAEKNGIPPEFRPSNLQYCLPPRAKGVETLLKAEKIKGIIDFTFSYPDADYYANYERAKDQELYEWYNLKDMILWGKRPRTIGMRIKYHLKGDIPTDSTQFNQWLWDRFKEKDHFLADFAANKGNPQDYQKAFIVPIGTKYSPIFVVYLSGIVLLLGMVIFKVFSKTGANKKPLAL